MSGFGARLVPAKTWGFKGANKKVLEIPGAPSNPQRHQMGHQELPKTAEIELKGDPEAPSRASLHSKGYFIKHIRFTVVKLRFTRVMGVRWRGQKRHREAPR